jgi:hypothetical protein
VFVDRTILLLLDTAGNPLVRSLTLESPITICGDLHGHFTNLRDAITIGAEFTQVRLSNVGFPGFILALTCVVLTFHAGTRFSSWATTWIMAIISFM